jgi:hypothetical protein
MSEETTKQEELTPTRTGFAILIDGEGNVFVERNPEALAIPLERECTMVELRRACSEILQDLQAQAAAEYTVLRFKALTDQAKAATSTEA